MFYVWGTFKTKGLKAKVRENTKIYHTIYIEAEVAVDVSKAICYNKFKLLIICIL